MEEYELDYDRAAGFWDERDAEMKDMPAEELRKVIDEFLESHAHCVLATASGDFVRATPIEYTWKDGCLWMFSEGGLKFRALKDNKNVCAAVFTDKPADQLGNLHSAQITGTAEIVEPMSDEYMEMLQFKHIPTNIVMRMVVPINLIKVVPSKIEILDSDLQDQGYGFRQKLEF